MWFLSFFRKLRKKEIDHENPEDPVKFNSFNIESIPHIIRDTQPATCPLVPCMAGG